MPNDKRTAPVPFQGVMVSSTFTDLIEHRKALIKAIDGQDLKAVVMENSSARLIDVLDASLQMVRKAAAYIGVISHKYGQIPKDAKRNPKELSLTELEFNEARDLGRPILLFVMGDDHPVTRGDVETNAKKARKLAAFLESAKQMSADSSVHRIYKVFNNRHEFEVAATQSIAELVRHLDRPSESPAEPDKPTPEPHNLIPTPPAVYAEPPYIGSHQFVGREAQLATLSDWAAAADPHPVLLFDAIGGTGKSMLTWEWTTKHATKARTDWAGRCWYSFYEKGAVMADFCRRALAYMTRRPLEDFSKKKTAELSELLLQQLRARPWLLVLDGLERVLVAYHRIDAAQLADEDAGGSDEIAHRDPRTAISPEDDGLLRTFSSVAPSKVLITSRLIPAILLNRSGQPIPGVRHERLPGLRPVDAEKLFRACGIAGTSEAIQTYLQSHCDCHPLVTGVLAGLINDYLPARGNFDAWVNDPNGGAALNLAALDLVQKRNHILRAGLDALPKEGRQLLSTLALLSESVDYPTLSALNPHSPSEPRPAERNGSLPSLDAERQLAGTIRDLERRGLLQYDPQARWYDLHPVVRGIAAGGLLQEERVSYGQRVVDYFSRQSHSPYALAETLEDVRHGLHVVRTLVQMGRQEEAAQAYQDDLSHALLFNLESNATVLSLLRPFFPHGWGVLPSEIGSAAASSIANEAGLALKAIGEYDEALAAFGCGLRSDMENRTLITAVPKISNTARAIFSQNRLAAAERWFRFAHDVATSLDDPDSLFRRRLDLFRYFATIGRAADAQRMWKLLDPMGRDWRRARYRPGMAELLFAEFHLYQGTLREEHLSTAESLAAGGKGRRLIRSLQLLRGHWQLEQGQWALAATSLHEATRMAREIGKTDAAAEAQLALANFHLDRLLDARHEAERLSSAKDVSHLNVAALWLAIDDREQARKYAVEAYRWAWSDGEPYVHRYSLNKARALLEQLGVEIPALPPYDPARDEKLPWEDEVAAAIKKLRKGKKKEASQKWQQEKRIKKTDSASNE